MKRIWLKALALVTLSAIILAGALSEEFNLLDENDLGLDVDVTLSELGEDVDYLDLGGEALEMPTTATYVFIVGEETYATQEARLGEEIRQPEAPEAPEGSTFAGWVLAGGAPLFADLDEDGQVDPVIVTEDALGSEVRVWASFEEAAREETAGEQATEEETAEEVTAEEETAEEEATEEETAGEAAAEEPSIEEPSDEPQPAEEPSDEAPAAEEPSDELQPAEAKAVEEIAGVAGPVANALVYTGEAQPLVSAVEPWLYSLDGEAYSAEVPTAVNAGEYTVYFKAAGEDEAGTVAVTVEKAEATFIPPVAATTEA